MCRVCVPKPTGQQGEGKKGEGGETHRAVSSSSGASVWEDSDCVRCALRCARMGGVVA